MPWFFFPALSTYVIILHHPLQETLKSTYKEVYVKTKHLNCSVMYIHLFWNEVDILYFHCTFIITSVLISQMFRLLSCSTSFFLFCFLLIHGEGACSIHLSSKLNNGIKHRSYHRKLVKKIFYWWLILSNTINLLWNPLAWEKFHTIP